jgi:hypothetical protein
MDIIQAKTLAISLPFVISFKSATTAGGGFTVGLMLALRAAAEKNVSLEAFDH